MTLSKTQYDKLRKPFDMMKHLHNHLTQTEIDRLFQPVTFEYDKKEHQAYLESSLTDNLPLSSYTSFSYVHSNNTSDRTRKKDSKPFVEAMQSYPSFADKLHFDTVIIGLNAGGTGQGVVNEPFENFHYNGLRKNGEKSYSSHAYNLHYGIHNTEHAGAYMTDAIKGFSTSSGPHMEKAFEVLEYELGLESHDLRNRFLLAYGDALKEELSYLGVENPKFLVLGKGDLIQDFIELNGFENCQFINHYARMQPSYYEEMFTPSLSQVVEDLSIDDKSISL